MAQPGFSLSELIVAIATAKKVYDSFFHTYESAPARIRELTDTLKYFRDTLIELETILRHYGTFYHGQVTFTRKLEECEAFLQEYSELRPAEPMKSSERGHTTLQKVRRVWQTTKMAFEDATISLRDGLSLELQKLITFLLLFALGRTVPGTEIAVSNQRSTASSSRPSNFRGSDIEQFGRLLQQLQDVRDLFTAELNLARQSNREPDLSTFYPDLENVWNLLCHRVGCSGESIPPLQREGLLQFSQPSSDLVVASAYVSESSTVNNYVPSSLAQDIADNRTGTITINFAIKSGKIQRYSLRFQRYFFSQGPEGPVFTWSDQGALTILRHYVPMKVFPHTLHRAVGSPLHITFLEREKHRLVLEKHDGIELDSITPVFLEYRFSLELQHQQFQEDLRNKDLVKTFDFDDIKSERSGKYEEARNQDLKLWHSRDYHQLHSLSFNSNAVERRHIEFPICWFDGRMDRDRSKTTVTLYFVQRITKSLPPVSSRKRWLWLPKLTLRRTKSNDIAPATIVISPPQPSSLTSLYDIEASSTHSDDHRFAPSNIATDLKFLFIKFSSLNHYDNFIEEFERAYTLDTLPQTFAPPQLALVEEDPRE